MCRGVGLQQTQQCGGEIIGNFKLRFYRNLETVTPCPQGRDFIAAPPFVKTDFFYLDEMGPEKMAGQVELVCWKIF